MTEEHIPQQAVENAGQAEDAADQGVELTSSNRSILKGDESLGRAQVFASAFLIVVAGLIAYSSSFTNPLFGADKALFTKTNGFASIARLPETLVGSNVSLLSGLTLAVNAWFSPDGLIGFRVINVLLHLASAMMCFLLIRRMFSGRLRETVAMTAGLAFALHPAATQAVNLLSGRDILLGVAFALWSCLLFLRAFDGPGPVRGALLAPAFAAMIAAWACEGTAALLVPLMITVMDRLAPGEQRASGRTSIKWMTWTLLAGLALVARVGYGTPADIFAVRPSGFLEALSAIPVYLKLTFMGRPLSVIHPLTENATASWVGIAVMAICIPCGIALALRRRPLGASLVWFGAALFAPMALGAATAHPDESLLYLALPGAALLIPWVYEALFSLDLARLVGGFALAILLAASGVATFVRNLDWASEKTLWDSAAKIAPSEPVITRELGLIAMRQAETRQQMVATSGDAMVSAELRDIQTVYEAAARFLEAAVAAKPDDPAAWAALGRCLQATGQMDQARDAYLSSLEYNPGDAQVSADLGMLYWTRYQKTPNAQDLSEALRYLSRAMSSSNRISPAYLPSFGFALADSGEYEQAGAVFTSAINAGVGAGEANTANPLDKYLKEMTNATDQLASLDQKMREASGSAANQYEALTLRAQLLMVRKDYLQATYLLDMMLNTQPADTNTWIMLGTARAIMGQKEGFLAQHPSPPPGMPAVTAWMNLATRLTATGNRWDLAEAYLLSPQAAENIKEPYCALAETAFQRKAAARGRDYLLKATETYPASPEPWLRLCDFSLTNRDAIAAKGYLDEAAKRNASPEAAAQRKVGIDELTSLPSQGATIIR